MLLAGPRPRPGRALPPSERNYSRGRLSRWRYPHRVSEAAEGGAEAATPPPRRARPLSCREWSSVSERSYQLTSGSWPSAEAQPPSQERRPYWSGSGLSTKTRGSCACQERTAAPHGPGSQQQMGLAGGPGERVSGLREAQGRGGALKKGPQLAGVGAHSPL